MPEIQPCAITRPVRGLRSADDQDLEKTAKCFYLGNPADAWRFLSKEAQVEAETREKFNALFKAHDPTIRSVKVLGLETKNGSVFGKVEVVFPLRS